AAKKSLYDHALHPYTKALLSSIPVIDTEDKNYQTREKIILSGDLPDPTNPPTGCAFRTRCPYAHERCIVERPELTEIGQDHFVACHLYTKEEETTDKDSFPS